MTGNAGALQERKANESSVVRPEAQPLVWSKLTQDQKWAVVRLHRWLEEFVGRPLPKAHHKGRRSPFDYLEIHESRPSNVILIDGGRGSGKTSVLITALGLWKRAASGEDLREGLLGRHRDSAHGDGEKPRDDEPDPQTEVIDRLKGSALVKKLVPIRPLDLQPLPPSTSLLTWIAGRILELVDHLEDPSGGREVRENTAPIASWEPDWNKELSSRHQWRKLLQCAALGWSSNLPERRGVLDPDSYAEELKQAERARLTMVDQWRYFVDAVISDAHRLYPHLVDEDARLIIPIDDADMNPHRCVDLLELMRSLWSPRLFFVLTGHSPLFQKTLHLHYLRLMRQPLGPGALTEKEFDYVEAHPNARQLALQAYDKVIPPGHRFKLAKLSGPERFALMKEVLSAPSAHIQKERVESFKPDTLAGYFELTPFLQMGLPHRLRQIQNVRQGLERDRHAGDMVRRLWVETVDNGEWNSEEQQLLKQQVLVNQDGGVRVDVEQKLEPVTRRLARLSSGAGTFLNVNIVTGFTFKVPFPDKQLPTREVRLRELPEFLTALLVLAMDVAADTVNGNFQRTYPAPRHDDYPLAVCHVHLPEKLPSQLAFTWPMPEWMAPVDFSVFDQFWAKHLLPLKDGNAPSVVIYGEMISLYLSGIFDTGMSRELTGLPPWRPNAAPRNPDSWAPLIQRIVDEAVDRRLSTSNRTMRMVAVLNWLLADFILIAAPEYGLPEGFANILLQQWLQALSGHEESLRKQAFEAVRQARRAKVEFATRNMRTKGVGAEEILAEIDAAHSQYEWGRVIEGRAAPVVGLPKEMDALLKQIRVQHGPRSTVQDPSSLDGYLEVLEVKPVLMSTNAHQLKELQESLGRYARLQGAAPLALAQLWRSFVVEHLSGDEKKSAERLFVEAGDRLRIILSERFEKWRSLPAGQRRRNETEVATSGQQRVPCSLRLFSLDPEFERPTGAADGLLQVAHDVQFDESDGYPTSAEKKAPKLRFRAIESVLPRVTTLVHLGHSSYEFDWPVPDWDTFLDWKLTDVLWQRAIREIASLLPEMGGRMSEAALAALFQAFLDGMRQLCYGRAFTELRLNLRVSSEDMDVVGRGIREILRETRASGKRLARSKEWVQEGAALYGAPETGMPVWAAAGYLRAWEMASHQEKVSIRKLRRQRAKVAFQRVHGPANEKALSAFLQELDRTTGDHPWFRIFGTDAAEAPPSPHSSKES